MSDGQHTDTAGNDFEYFWSQYGIRFVNILHMFALQQGGLVKYSKSLSDESYDIETEELIRDYGDFVLRGLKTNHHDLASLSQAERSYYQSFCWKIYDFIKEKHNLVFGGDEGIKSNIGDGLVELFNLIINPFPIEKKRRKNKNTIGFKTACRLHYDMSDVDPFDFTDDSASSSISPKLKKFWDKRYYLFSRFNSHIRLDEESWYSVTPEILAEHHAKRCASELIADLFCGCGGNIIQFSKTCNFVIAGDIDPLKVEMAVHNSKIYECKNNIDFIIIDACHLVRCLRVDMLFASPPWGGPSYKEKRRWCVQSDMIPNIEQMVEGINCLSESMILYLPSSLNYTPLFKVAHQFFKDNIEIEKNYINGTVKATTVYFGKVASKKK